jgi:hypothetical protein
VTFKAQGFKSRGMFAFLLVGMVGTAGAATVCRAANNSGWPYQVNKAGWPSCASSSGSTNDMGSVPTGCANDLSSVRIEVRPGLAECLVAHAGSCKIPMHDFVSLDYEFHVSGCNGIWAAPMWMTPDLWQWGAGSGEIDSMEMCPRDAIALNFAGGGHQVRSTFNINDAEGHVTVRKDNAGIVTIAICTMAEAGSGQCPAPSYANCAACLNGGNRYACWCNEATNPPNIYGSGGCQNGGNCMWTLVSDVWNGVRGDSGYTACMNAVTGVVGAHVPNLNSKCAFSIEKVRLRGGGAGGRLQWGAGSPSSCSALTV